MTDLEIDPAILKVIPPGSEILFADSHGKTNWAKGLKIEVELDGEEKAFFLKVERERALEMAEGEFESQKAMKQFIPDNMSQPLAWGPLEKNPSQAFFMCEFRDLRVIKPAPNSVASILSQLHRDSVSPTGLFGFPVSTFKGYAPMNNEWCERWEDWFGRQFRMDIQFEQSVRGPDPEMDKLFEVFVAKVVPRLLRPLQTGETQTPLVFDACCVYGHHEMELGMFRGQHYGWTPEYMEQYLKEVDQSEPQEDFDDRNAIYAMRNYIVTAGLWQHWAHLRTFVKDEMRRLIEKHPDGFEGFQEKRELAQL
ncbi:hypothetical protein ACHAQH_005871 [Verticillium albo-atrum]